MGVTETLDSIVTWLVPNGEPDAGRIVGMALLIWVPLFFHTIWRDRKKSKDE